MFRIDMKHLWKLHEGKIVLNDPEREKELLKQFVSALIKNSSDVMACFLRELTNNPFLWLVH